MPAIVGAQATPVNDASVVFGAGYGTTPPMGIMALK